MKTCWIFLIVLALTCTLNLQAQRISLKPIKTVGLALNEPSEIIASANPTMFYILGEKARLFEWDAQHNTFSKTTFEGYDVEGACMYKQQLVIVDESMRWVYALDTSTWKTMFSTELLYGGARNLGFESITYIPESNHFILATEKAPCVFYEMDDQFHTLNRMSIKGIREVSSMCYHNNKLYVLSDEDASIFEVDMPTKQVMKTYTIPVINPEGLCFNQQGELMVVSDDMNKLFIFKLPAL